MITTEQRWLEIRLPSLRVRPMALNFKHTVNKPGARNQAISLAILVVVNKRSKLHAHLKLA